VQQTCLRCGWKFYVRLGFVRNSIDFAAVKYVKSVLRFDEITIIS